MLKPDKGGFTLIEVLVSLGIAGGAMILLLSANTASLRRSTSSREDLRVLHAAESRYQAILLGVDRSASGELEGLPGWRWQTSRVAASVAGLKRVKRIQFVVTRPDGSKAMEWGAFCEGE